MIELAGKATPGNWEVLGTNSGSKSRYRIMPDPKTTEQQYINARFIESADPTTIQSILTELIEAREVIKSIASQNEPMHSYQKYWLKISHEDCALVLANDTKVSRKHLKKWSGE
jgi:hypothetical protein